jgi:branched-chain amino acid aminotransferase
MEMNKITRDKIFSILDKDPKPWQEEYIAMYSSQWQGFTLDPTLMMIPVDDHLVHRGDGVFETMRCVRGRIYQMDPHLERLEKSARAISLKMPREYDKVREIVGRLVVLGNIKDCVIRIFISRGPGSFGTNPFDCPASQMYVVLIRFKDVPEETLREGTSVVTSGMPIKRSFFARIKSCNYLSNVLIKMEAVQQGCPYAVALDDDGFLTEGSTENIGLLSQDGVLKFPGFEKTLAGTTVKRVWEMAEYLIPDGGISDVRFDSIPLEEAYSAREVMLLGTSINVLPVVRFDGKPVGNGKPGPITSELCRLLGKDMIENHELLTDLDWPDDAE